MNNKPGASPNSVKSATNGERESLKKAHGIDPRTTEITRIPCSTFDLRPATTIPYVLQTGDLKVGFDRLCSRN